jgi:cysteinyl-tRNA synthetase
MHNGFLQVEGEKMAKSAGNFVTIHELLADWPGEVLRFNMLRTHYRQPIDWTLKGMEESYDTLRSFTERPDVLGGGGGTPAPAVLEALCDDLNTPKAITELHALHAFHEYAALGASLRGLGFNSRPESKRAVDKAKVDILIAERLSARQAKNFKEADRIRDQLAAMGVVLKDSKDGTTWELAR